MSDKTDAITPDSTPEPEPTEIGSLSKAGQVKQFYTDVNSELKKVTWPTRDEVYGTTVVVLIAVIFFGAFLWVADNAIGFVFKFIVDALK